MKTESPIARFLIITAAFIIVVAGMQSAEELLVPFLLSLFIAVISSPPLVWLKEKGVPNGLAILCIIACVVVIGLLIGIVVGSSITSFREDLPEYQTKLTAISADLFAKLQSFGLDMDLSRLKESFNPAAALSLAGITIASFGNVMTNGVLILLTVIFILAEEVGFSEKMRLANNNVESTLEAVHRFTKSVNRYMAIKTWLSLVTGGLIMLWLYILDVDYFVLWGLLAFLLNFIPTLGSILAAVPAVLLALVQLGPGDALLTGLGFIVVNFGVGNVVEPRVMGRGLDLSALVVFLSLVFWGWVLGPVGMLLSVPLTMTIKIALESFEDTRWLGIMLGSGKSAAKPLAIYDQAVANRPLDKPAGRLSDGDADYSGQDA